MADVLPAIDIKISVAASLFLERMAALGEQTGRFAIEHVDDRLGGTKLEVVNFRFVGESPHEEHGFQLIARDEMCDRIQVEMRARRWSPDPPTEQVYSKSASDLIKPLLTRYNREFGTRHRLRIGGRRAAKPFRMSAKSETLLKRFTILANTSALHPLDWGRFYELVRAGRQRIPGHVMRDRLVVAGFTQEKADHLAKVYHHLWEFKQLR